jgi:hypothetical protein
LRARQAEAAVPAAPARPERRAVQPDPGPRTRLWLRSCSSEQDAQADLERGRSLRGYGTAGWCWRCWAESDLDPDRAWSEDEVLDALGLEAAPGLELSPGVARCGHAGAAYASYLPGLCALAADLGPEDVEDAVARVVAGGAYRNDFLALYEGEDAGELDPDEGYELFHPTRIVWVRPWPA